MASRGAGETLGDPRARPATRRAEAKGPDQDRDAAARAFGVIERTVVEQATLLAYIDIFFGYSLLAAVLVPAAFILLRPT